MGFWFSVGGLAGWFGGFFKHYPKNKKKELFILKLGSADLAVNAYTLLERTETGKGLKIKNKEKILCEIM